MADSGVGPGAPVAFVPHNRPSSVAALLALIRQGRTIRMSYAFQSASGIVRDIQRLRPRLVVLDMQELSDELVLAVRNDGIHAIGLCGMEASAVPGLQIAPPATQIAAEHDQPAIEVLTSGTTGPPKQFAISYATIADHIVGTSSLAGLHEAQLATLPPTLLFFPLSNISGIYSTLPAMMFGQRAVLLERFSIAAWHDYVLTYRPSHAGMPSACLQMVLDAGIPKEDLASLKVIGTGAAPLDPSVHHAFEDKYGIPVLLSYGATEFGGPVTAMTAELHARWGKEKFGSVGRPIGGAQLRVVDPDANRILPPGEVGLLEVVAPRIGPNWIRTSDIALIDRDGFLFHRGRADGAIMRGGFKVLPETIEQALMRHPAVAEAAVVGLADKRVGEIPAALIRFKPGVETPNLSSLEGHLRQHVLSTHIPVRWQVCEEMPRTPSHKVDRAAIRRMFADS
jgi:acyl-coenzyme A synthetase/AMP-(fatty) acid ligase